MPIFDFVCCDNEIEVVQLMGEDSPTCLKCGGVMAKKPSLIAPIQVTNEGRRVRSKGYKEGYKKEYLKSKGQEAWRGQIISPDS
jgi:predicted nucleic acid-binding Zn ribbon protein